MATTTLDETYIPLTYSHAINTGEDLTITFTLSENEALPKEKCRDTVKLNCRSTGVTGLTDVNFRWASFCNSFTDYNTDNEGDADVDISLIPDDGNPVTQISIVLANSLVSFRNEFYLYGLVNGEYVLLARGVIFSQK